MKKQNQFNPATIEIRSLSSEISQKSILIAQLNAQVYKLMDANEKLKKQLKSSKHSTKGSK